MSDSFATPLTVAHQTPLSMRVPSQENWTGLPFFFSNVHLVAHFNMNSSGGMRYYGDGWNLNFSVYILWSSSLIPLCDDIDWMSILGGLRQKNMETDDQWT